MKQILIVLLLSTTSLFAKDFSQIRTIVSNYRNINSPEDLVIKINKNFHTKEDKLKAGFYWLATNITYDIATLGTSKKQYRFKYKDEVDKLQKIKVIQNGFVNELFLKRKGICEEYALSLKKICELLQIPCKVIKGVVRVSAHEIGNIDRNTNHAWNIVYVNKKWIFIDTTWASGFQMNKKWTQNFNSYFYNTPKHRAIQTHYSNDLIWKRFFNPIGLKTFYYQPIFHQSFLKTKTKIVSPKSGFIRRNNSKKIELILKDLNPNITIFYSYKGDKYSRKPTILRNGTNSKLILEAPLKSTHLQIFFDNKIALQYKIL